MNVAKAARDLERSLRSHQAARASAGCRRSGVGQPRTSDPQIAAAAGDASGVQLGRQRHGELARDAQRLAQLGHRDAVGVIAAAAGGPCGRADAMVTDGSRCRRARRSRLLRSSSRSVALCRRRRARAAPRHRPAGGNEGVVDQRIVVRSQPVRVRPPPTTSSSRLATARSRSSSAARSSPASPASAIRAAHRSRAWPAAIGRHDPWPTVGSRRSPVSASSSSTSVQPRSAITRSTARSGRGLRRRQHRRDVEHLAAADGLVCDRTRAARTDRRAAAAARPPGAGAPGRRRPGGWRRDRARAPSPGTRPTRCTPGTHRGATPRGRAGQHVQRGVEAPGRPPLRGDTTTSPRGDLVVIDAGEVRARRGCRACDRSSGRAVRLDRSGPGRRRRRHDTC